MNSTRRAVLAGAAAATALPLLAHAQGPPLKFGVGMFQPDREKNDATYRPLALHPSQPMSYAKRSD